MCFILGNNTVQARELTHSPIVYTDTLPTDMQSRERSNTDSTVDFANASTNLTNIERYTNRRWQLWNNIIPRQVILQYAGNIGLASWGLGWNYGKRDQWETHFLTGLIPRYHTERMKMTLTLRQVYLPWNIPIKRSIPLAQNRSHVTISISPLTISLVTNTVLDNQDFWTKQPERYPQGYYWFSTRLHNHLAIGQRLNHTFTSDNRMGMYGYSLYWEVSSTEFDILYKIQNRSLPIRNILHLGVGIKFQML